ncbi:MAG: hypothetical protein LBI18_02630, partial [Planctomycetaceae bacterium]|nr:hypothetical protein [Planctomycetaceae bacterium]
PKKIGCEEVWTAEVSGKLFFRINDFPSELSDNLGNVTVKIISEHTNAENVNSDKHRVFLIENFQNDINDCLNGIDKQYKNEIATVMTLNFQNLKK